MSLVITTDPIGGVKNRLNITEFVKNERFFTLYIHALGESITQNLHFPVIEMLFTSEDMQKKPQDGNHWKSFFQLSGIHGLPFVNWAKKHPPPQPNQAGYCAHGQVLFLTWHRAYVSIYEVHPAVVLSTVNDD